MTFLILFLFFIWDRSLFLFNLNACMHVSEVLLLRLEHQSLSSIFHKYLYLWSDYHAMGASYTIGISNCLVSVVQFRHGNQSLSLSLSLSLRIMQLFSCHSGLLQQWLLVCGPCASIYMLIYGITNHTHMESESETERERQRQREWENGREAQRRWYSRLDWSPGISNTNTAKQGYVYQIVRLLEI